jgi:hypothetical protein
MKNVIVEIKGQRWIDVALETFKAKIDALRKYCESIGCIYRVFYDKDLKAYVKKANSYHETQKQNNI